MSLERATLSERFTAHVTRVRTLPGMYLQVFFKRVLPAVALLTHGTLKVSFPRVFQHVETQTPPRKERRVALGADVRALLKMDAAHVNRKVRLQTEPLGTVFARVFFVLLAVGRH